MGNVEAYIAKKVAENKAKANQITKAQNNLEANHSFIYNNPALAELGKGANDLAKVVIDAGSYAQSLLNGEPPVQANLPTTKFAKLVSQAEQVSPIYNGINELTSMVPQAVALDATGTNELLSRFVGNVAGKAVSKLFNKGNGINEIAPTTQQVLALENNGAKKLLSHSNGKTVGNITSKKMLPMRPPMVTQKMVPMVPRTHALETTDNGINKMLPMVPQTLAKDATGNGGSLALFRGTGNGNIASKVVNKKIGIVKKVAEATGRSLGEGFGFAVTDPHTLTGEGGQVYDQNTFEHLNPLSIFASTAETGAMIGAGRLVPKGIELANKGVSSAFNNIGSALNKAKDIKNTVSDSVGSTLNKMKPKYDIKGNKIEPGVAREAKVKTDSTDNSAFGVDNIDFNNYHEKTHKSKADELIAKIDQQPVNENTGSLEQIKNDVEFISKTKQEHIDNITNLDKQAKQASDNGDIKRANELIAAKNEYTNRLAKDFGFTDTDRTIAIQEQLNTLGKAIDTRIQNLTEKTDPKRLNSSNNIQKAKNANTPFDKQLAKDYIEYKKLSEQIWNEKKKFLNEVFKKDKFYNEYQRGRINDLIDRYNNDLSSDPSTNSAAYVEHIPEPPILNKKTNGTVLAEEPTIFDTKTKTEESKKPNPQTKPKKPEAPKTQEIKNLKFKDNLGIEHNIKVVQVADPASIRDGQGNFRVYVPEENKIYINGNGDFWDKKFKERIWTDSYKEADGSFSDPLPEDAIKTPQELKNFILMGDVAIKILGEMKKGETLGAYLTKIDKKALELMKEYEAKTTIPKTEKPKKTLVKKSKTTVKKKTPAKKTTGSKKTPVEKPNPKEPTKPTSEPKTEEPTPPKPPKEPKEPTFQDKINNASMVALDYVKHHLDKINLNLGSKKPTNRIIISKSRIKELTDKGVVEGKYDPNTGSKDIKLSQFQADKHTHNFLNEIRLIAHEISHSIVYNSKLKLNHLTIPDSVKEAYKDASKQAQLDEALSLYSELRSMRDAIKHSNLSKLIKDPVQLIKEIDREIEKNFGSNKGNFERLYKKEIQYNVFDNIKELKDSIFNTDYWQEKADEIGKSLIENFTKKIIELGYKNEKVKNIFDAIKNNDFIKNAVADYKISQSPEKLYSKIRDIISKKNKYMNHIKFVNNTYTKMVNKDFGHLNKEVNEHIHNSNVLYGFVTSGSKTLKEYIETKILSHELALQTFMKNNIISYNNGFRKIIRASSEPMNNDTYYFRNPEQILKFLENNKIIKEVSENKREKVISDIEDLLTSEYLSKHKIDTKGLEKITPNSDGVLAIKQVNNLAKKTLGYEYIRGFKSFIPKKPVISKLGLFDKEPTYKTDIRGNISNNILEFNQDSILGAEFLGTKNKVRAVRAKLNKLGLKYSIVRDINGNEIGVKRFIEPMLDKKNMGYNFDIAENIASQNTALNINTINYSMAMSIEKDLKGIFINEKTLKNIKNKQDYVELSNEEKKIFNQVNPDKPIKYVKKEFKDILTAQKEFLLTKENQIVARTIEKIWKDSVKNFKKNVVVKNVKSQVNNLAVILSTAMEHNINVKALSKDMFHARREYKTFYSTMYKIKEHQLHGREKQARILYENLKRNNVYAQLHEAGGFQTMADNYLVAVSPKDSLALHEMNQKMGDIFSSDTKEAMKKIKDFVMLNPNTAAGSFLLRSMNGIDVSGRAAIFKNLMKKGMTAKEASRIANESFVDFRRTYPKIVNELDDYGLFFAGFMYKNTINLLKFMKDKPVTTASVVSSYYMLSSMLDSDNNTDTIAGVKADSWLYQGSMVSPSYINMSLFGFLYDGKLPYQFVVPNTTIMAGRAISSGDISKIAPVTIHPRHFS